MNNEQPATSSDSLAYPALAGKRIEFRNYKTGGLVKFTQFNDKGQMGEVVDVSQK